MSPTFDHSLYSERRKELASLLGPDSVAIIPTSSEQPRNRDSDYLFRHDSYFYYLTGFTEPNACLVLFANGDSTLYCQPKDLEREIWDGYRLGPEEAIHTLGVTHARSFAEIDSHLPVLLENTNSVWYPFAIHKGLTERIDHWLRSVQAKSRSGISAPQQLRNVCTLLDEMRLIKDAHEIDLMKKAALISAQAHLKAMQFCGSSFRDNKPICEYHLDAEILYEFRRHGSEYPAYASIVASGSNACVLHYRADKAPIKDGDLVLIDAGCEFASYAGDITRTFPANGHYSKPQRALYDVVLESQYAAISATREGALFTDPHNAALKVLAKGLLELNILNANIHGGVEDVIENKHYFPYYMHRTSHWLGMDVHDCGSYSEPQAGDRGKTPTPRILKAGMALTIEPGLYIRPAAHIPEAFHNIGIRIEDDAVVAKGGCELLSRDVPVDPLEIERLMS